MAEPRKTPRREERGAELEPGHRLSLTPEEAVERALKAYRSLPEDFPEDLKRLSFEKTLEHYLQLVEESERRAFELALERLRMEKQLKSDELVFKGIFHMFEKVADVLIEETRPRPIPILPVAVKEEAQDGEATIPLPPKLKPKD